MTMQKLVLRSKFVSLALMLALVASGAGFVPTGLGSDPNNCGAGYDFLADQSVSSGVAELYGNEAGWCVWYDITDSSSICSSDTHATTNFPFHTMISSGSGTALDGGSQSSANSEASEEGPRSGLVTDAWPDGTGDSANWFVGWSRVDTCTTSPSSTTTRTANWDCELSGSIDPNEAFPWIPVIAVAAFVAACVELGASWEETSGESEIFNTPLHNADQIPISVDLPPGISSFGWTGKSWGCDSVDFLELILGPREIDGYEVSTDIQDVTDVYLDGSISPSVIHDINGFDGFDDVIQNHKGVEARYSSSSPASFSGYVDFDVDYELGEQTGAAFHSAAALADGESPNGWETNPCSKIFPDIESDEQSWEAIIFASNNIKSINENSDMGVIVHLDAEHLESEDDDEDNS